MWIAQSVKLLLQRWLPPRSHSYRLILPPPTEQKAMGHHTSLRGGQSVELLSPPKSISVGSIVVIIALVMIVLCVMWTCCRKRNEKGGKTSTQKAVTKGKGMPAFNEKSFKRKASKRKTMKYDEFDHYDPLESDDADEDDQCWDKSERSSRKTKGKMKKDAPKKRFFRRRGECTTEKKKRPTNTKEAMNENPEIDANYGRHEEDHSSGNDSGEGLFEDEEEDDQEVERRQPSTAKKGAKQGTKLRNSFGLGSSVHKSFDKTKEKLVLASASKPFNPFD
jgi:hypothetical protein